jgi:hypothetical protein
LINGIENTTESLVLIEDLNNILNGLNMLSFTDFLIEKENAVAKINEGDVMEGIFSIACALYIAYGKIEKTKLNTLRTQIEPSKFTAGRVNIPIVSGQTIGKDTLTVELQIRLKPKSVTGAFGKDFQFYIQKQSDIGDLNRKIDLIISSAESSRYLQKLNVAKNRYLQNNTAEDIGFMIVADGVEGEQSGGAVKGDVMITLYVKKAGERQNLLVDPETISYSIKSGSKTAASLSPYNGMLAIAKHFSVKYSHPEKYESILSRAARTPAEKQATNDAIRMMFDELRKLIVAKGSAVTKDAFEYIRYHVQGTDQAFLVDIDKTKLKEIPVERFKTLQDSGVQIKAVIDGEFLKFVSVKEPKLILFQLRLKLRESSSGSAERKFYVETGNMLY